MRSFNLLIACLFSASLAAAEPAIAIPLAIEETPQPAGFRVLQLGKDGRTDLVLASAPAPLAIADAKDGLLIDRNGDGRCDSADEPAVPVGGRFTLPVTVGSRLADYTFQVLFRQKDTVILGSSCVLAGSAGGLGVRFDDGDGDGRFAAGARDTVSFGSATVARTADACDGGTPRGLPLTPLMIAQGKVWKARFVAGTPSLVLDPYDGPLHQITLRLHGAAPPATMPQVLSGSLVLAHVDGLVQAAFNAGETLPLPPGRYRVADAQLMLAVPQAPRRSLGGTLFKAFTGLAAGGGTATILLSGAGDENPMVIDGDRVIDRGLPTGLAFQMTGVDGARTVESFALTGAHGERWRPLGDSAAATLLIRAGGAERTLGKMEYG